MSKNNKNNNETINEEVKVNTPERTDEMDEREENKQQDEFFNDEDNDISDGADNEDSNESKDSADDQDGDKKTGLIGKAFGFFKKHWKGLLAAGLISVVGGCVVFYFLGKKQIKLGKVEEVAKALEADGKKADVINFAEAMEDMAKDMKENPENHEVVNF